MESEEESEPHTENPSKGEDTHHGSTTNHSDIKLSPEEVEIGQEIEQEI